MTSHTSPYDVIHQAVTELWRESAAATAASRSAADTLRKPSEQGVVFSGATSFPGFRWFLFLFLFLMAMMRTTMRKAMRNAANTPRRIQLTAVHVTGREVDTPLQNGIEDRTKL